MINEKTNAETVIEKESAFHDHWASGVNVENVKVFDTFVQPTCPENIFILEKLGNLDGKLLLELGTGQGEGVTYFSIKGAKTIASDLSSGMVKLAKKVGRYHGVAFEGVVCDANCLPFKSSSFDVVYGANILHHINLETSLKEVFRILKPEGKAAFWEPLAYNPVINKYRKMATQVRTDDEHPLSRADVNLMNEYFSKMQSGFFGLATLCVFLKFYFFDMIHPNEERYWKKIVTDYSSFSRFYDFLRSIDRIILSIPGIKWLAWNIAVVLQK